MKAFPNVMNSGEMGMDLRDYFAAKALQGLLSNQPVFSKEATIDGETLTESAYQIADAMMEMRNK